MANLENRITALENQHKKRLYSYPPIQCTKEEAQAVYDRIMKTDTTIFESDLPDDPIECSRMYQQIMSGNI